MRGLGRHYELRITCTGQIDPTSTYLIDIKEIDRAVHAAAIPILEDICRRNPGAEPADVVPALLAPLTTSLPSLQSLRFFPSPYHSVEMTAAAPDTVLLRQKFDFSASHRLHIPALSAEENRTLFGKCNNPSGHGHNYQIEPCIAATLIGSGRDSVSLAQFERLVDQTIIQRFDHKYLNVDTEEFRVESGGLNPSVENIARVCYDLLRAAIAREFPSASLRSVTVWETDRTSATYPA